MKDTSAHMSTVSRDKRDVIRATYVHMSMVRRDKGDGTIDTFSHTQGEEGAEGAL
jgi:hypothetical protein